MIISLEWTEFKLKSSSLNVSIQYQENSKSYLCWIDEGNINYKCKISKSNLTEKDDFEDNYKDNANQPLVPRDIDGKEFVRAESRPLNKTTYFTMAGDSENGIGAGTLLLWDFSNDDDLLSVPSGSNYKIKRIEFNFIDAINVKEGTIYFKDMKFGSFIDLQVVCPNGNYYLKNDGTPALASEDTVVNHFVNKHHMLDTCVIGDELNTEASSNEIPNNYKFWLDITVPDDDVTSKGFVSIELYRDRTVIL